VALGMQPALAAHTVGRAHAAVIQNPLGLCHRCEHGDDWRAAVRTDRSQLA
jgi:hypothetical protein